MPFYVGRMLGAWWGIPSLKALVGLDGDGSETCSGRPCCDFFLCPLIQGEGNCVETSKRGQIWLRISFLIRPPGSEPGLGLLVEISFWSLASRRTGVLSPQAEASIPSLD